MPPLCATPLNALTPTHKPPSDLNNATVSIKVFTLLLQTASSTSSSVIISVVPTVFKQYTSTFELSSTEKMRFWHTSP